MNKGKIWKWEWVILILWLIGNAVYILYDTKMHSQIKPMNINATYQKINMCLTCGSILLAATALFFGNLLKWENEILLSSIKKALAWFLTSLISGIATVAVIPLHIEHDKFLNSSHLALWLWTYLTGPLMFISIILGCVWLWKTFRLFLATKLGASNG